MLTALLLLAIFFGLVQEVKLPGKMRFKKHGGKRSALVTVSGKSKS